MVNPIYRPFTQTVGQNAQGGDQIPQGLTPLVEQQGLRAYIQNAQQASTSLTNSLRALAAADARWEQQGPPPFVPETEAALAARLQALGQHLGQLSQSARPLPGLVRSTVASTTPNWLFTAVFVYLANGFLFSPMDLNEWLAARFEPKSTKDRAARYGLTVGLGLLGFAATWIIWQLSFGAPPAWGGLAGVGAYVAMNAWITPWLDAETARWAYLAAAVFLFAMMAMKSNGAAPQTPVALQPGAQPQALVPQQGVAQAQNGARAQRPQGRSQITGTGILVILGGGSLLVVGVILWIFYELGAFSKNGKAKKKMK